MSFDKIHKAVEERRSATIKVGPHKVKLYYGKRRGRFTLCWYNGTKRERLESSDPQTIVGTAEKLVGAFEKGSSLAASISPERVQEFVEAETLLSGMNLIELVKNHKQAQALKNTTVAQACAAFEESIQHNSHHYRRTVKYQLNKFKRCFAGPIASITTAELDAYLKKIIHPKTRLNNRRTLSTLFKFGQRKNFIPYGMTAIDKTDRPYIAPNDEPHTLTPEELNTLLLTALKHDSKIASFLAIGAFAGCRTTEIQRLLWKDVLEDSIVLGSSKTKTRRRRIAEMPANLIAWMERLRKGPDDHITYPESEGQLHKKLARICRKAKINWAQNCLRHTFVSSHLELHRDPPRTSKTSGHSLSVLESNYLKLIPQSRAKAWFEINPPAPEPTKEKTHTIEKEAKDA